MECFNNTEEFYNIKTCITVEKQVSSKLSGISSGLDATKSNFDQVRSDIEELYTVSTIDL